MVEALKKEDGLIWKEDRVVYIEEKVYVSNNKKITTQWIWNIQDNNGC